MPSTSATNPLLQVEFRIPFDQIRAEHVQPAAAELLRESRARLAALAAPDGPRTFANTLHALDTLTEPLDWAMGVVRHLESVATYPELRAAFNAAQPEVSAFYTGIPLDAGLWNNIKAFAATSEGSAARPARGAASCTRPSRRSAATAPISTPAGKKRLEEIDVELTQITTKFAENVLDSTNAFELVLTDEAALAGLPPTAIASARESAQRKGLEGWRFTLQAPDYLAVMTYLDNRRHPPASLRGLRGARATGRVRTTARSSCASSSCAARRPRCWASPISPTSCWKTAWRTPATAPWPSWKTSRPRPSAASTRRIGNCCEFRRSLEGAGAPELAPWDVAYYAEKQRAALYDFDEEALRPYFPMERVVAGLFELVHRLYGIRVEEEMGVPAWDAGGALLQRARRGRRLPGRFLRRLVSAREQARRRLDGRPDHRRPGDRWLPSRTSD